MSENEEYYDESTYQFPEDEKKDIDDNILKKRQYVRKQPKKPQTEAQRAAFEKARAKLLENRNSNNNNVPKGMLCVPSQSHNQIARKSQPQNNINSRRVVSNTIAQSKREPLRQPIKQPIKQQHKIINEPINDTDYTDEENEEQFMITDNRNKNYIVRPVIKRTKPLPTKRTRASRGSLYLAPNVKQNIDIKKLDNIVETQINNIEKSKMGLLHRPVGRNNQNNNNFLICIIIRMLSKYSKILLLLLLINVIDL